MRPLRAALILALLAAPPALAAKPKPTKAPAAAAPAVAEASPFAAIDEQLTRGQSGPAASAAAAILADPAQAALHGGAWARLGVAYRQSGKPYAGLVALAHAASLDPAATALWYGDLLALADLVSEGVFVGGVVGKDFSVPMDAATRGKVAFLAARALTAEGSWGQALGLLPLVPDNAPYALEAEVLRGVVLAQQDRPSEALVPLLTSYEQARSTQRDPHYVATLALNVARTFYAQGNYGRAMEYYDKVPRSDESWPTAHFERAWAQFRIEDMPGTVAVLTTHTTPFFDDWYFPEAELLRAQALYLMCKFGEVETSVEAFKARYTPIAKALDGVLDTMSPADALADVRTLRDPQTTATTRLPRSILRRFGSDARLTEALAAIEKAEADLAALGSGPGDALVKPLLQARRDARVREEGTRVLNAAREARAELDDMLQDLELTLVDIGSQLANLYDRAAATGEAVDLGGDAALRDLRKKGKRTWPFEGEYWADELGWYKVLALPECPASMQRGN